MIRIAFAIFALLFCWTPRAEAALPPLELAQKSVAQERREQGKIPLNLRVTLTGDAIREWSIEGEFAYGGPLPGPGDTTFDADSDLPGRLLWIALAAVDPVTELAKLGGFVNGRTTSIDVQEKFVYVYGSNPSFRFFRDLERIAGFDLTHDDRRWSVRLQWSEATVVAVVITRDGRTVLTARDTKVRIRSAEE